MNGSQLLVDVIQLLRAFSLMDPLISRCTSRFQGKLQKIRYSTLLLYVEPDGQLHSGQLPGLSITCKTRQLSDELRCQTAIKAEV